MDDKLVIVYAIIYVGTSVWGIYLVLTGLNKMFNLMEKDIEINERLSKTEVMFSCPWCGYFERLYGAEIVISDSDMKIEF